MYFFLGLHVSQLDDGIFICKAKYIKEMLKKFKMEECKSISIPLIIGWNLRKDDESKLVDQILYRSIIGILHYVIDSWLDVM